MDQGGLMSNVLRALTELLSEIRSHIIFKLCIRTQIDSVPELWLPCMQVVDTVEVQVFLVPAEHGLPRANVNIGRCDTFNVRVRLQSITKNKN